MRRLNPERSRVSPSADMRIDQASGDLPCKSALRLGFIEDQAISGRSAGGKTKQDLLATP